MKKILLTIAFILNLSVCYASLIVYGTTYGPQGTVTNTNLNGNFSNASLVVNGLLDNTNANTTAGFRFYETLAALPTTGLTQGRTVFLTSDNSWNVYTGSGWSKFLSQSVYDYGTSLTASTQKFTLINAYGATPSAIGTTSCVNVTGLPFTSVTSFACSSTGQGSGGTWVGGIVNSNLSASSITICNTSSTRTIKAIWSCQGT